MKAQHCLIIAAVLVAGASCKPEPTASSTAAAPEIGQAAQERDHAQDPAPGVKNPVKHEMKLLSIAMHNSLDAIANDELAKIPEEIAKVHPAKVATEKAVKAGTYAPPKNSDRLDDFAKLDTEFHDKLRGLLGAAKANDRPAAAAAYGELVQGCVTCHQTFR